ncbi:MAG: PQQ-like beta-propeller repeat protein [Verrucomicrobia subdivision 3 bacterium]|nr:PQQ-like beta-propeller repeat protein [Limisphaerales bacterium]
MRAITFLYGALCAGTLVAADSWWQFRGPHGDGHAKQAALPLNWSETKNVEWKTAIHDRGFSSPVIWGKQVWLTTATADGRKLFGVCVDKDTGKIIYDLHLFDVADPQAITPENTYASPSPVIEKGRVFLHFGTYGTACVETATGKVLWTRRDLNCDHEKGAGPASSPMLFGNTMIVHVDGRDVQYIVALDTATGKTVWKTPRSLNYSKFPVHHRKAYSMPMLVPRGKGQQLVSPAGRGLYAYDPKTGKELWHMRHRGWSVAPRPISGHGLIFATIDRDTPELWAIRPDGNGDITDTHIAWREKRGMPERSSPLLVDDLLYFVNRGGIATCLEAKTGKEVWKERLKGAYSASPIYAKGRIYLFNETGMATILRPGRKFEIITTNALKPQPLLASPAVDGNAFIIRTGGHLYRVENP